MKSHEMQVRFKSEYALVAHSPDTVELRAGVWNPRSITLTDESARGTLLPMLKGIQAGAAPASIASTLGVARSEVEALLDSLLEVGVVSTGQSGHLNALIERQASLPMIEKELDSRVLLIGDRAVSEAIHRQIAAELADRVELVADADPLLLRLAELDLMAFTDGLAREALFEKFEAWKDTVVVFGASHLNPITFAVLDEIAQGVGFVWLHGVIDGPYVFVGPTIIPGRSANYRDLEQRFMMNTRELASYQKYKDALAKEMVIGEGDPLGGPLVDLLAAHLSIEVVNWLKSGANFTVNKILGIYLPTMEMAYHEILPSPFNSSATSLQSRDATDLYFNVRDWLGENDD
ncbi:hypothetical protein [Microbacterium trichothecenolyticum]|uniref:Uncharacterized protein n=1 Tax=Microbacterium trichothecenolyticum TaxID=69370 RepID=A0ABU0TSI2_MICTR|nr:hypothetical protein [Microbacterium trichothecenolyticum]MDQ1122637.1 hypothetical protein [Microbacterium trichothecenolyticum]